MSVRITSRGRSSTMKSALVCNDPQTLQSRPTHLPNPLTGQILSMKKPPKAPNELAQVLTDIDGVPVLVRFLVGDASVEMQCHLASANADLHSQLSSTVEKMVDRIGGSLLGCDARSKQTLATAESISSPERLARLPNSSGDTVLRVGPLELDLLDRTAKRGDRPIDLRPREFQLLRYMVQRADELLTRAAILRDVWNYKFVPETNLVDVHMGKLRRKVDGPNEPPLIRNVRGVGFVLSATALLHCPTPTRDRRTEAGAPDAARGALKARCNAEQSRRRFECKQGHGTCAAMHGEQPRRPHDHFFPSIPRPCRFALRRASSEAPGTARAHSYLAVLENLDAS
jgi:DNA-binding response OmpR family regulator